MVTSLPKCESPSGDAKITFLTNPKDTNVRKAISEKPQDLGVEPELPAVFNALCCNCGSFQYLGHLSLERNRT